MALYANSKRLYYEMGRRLRNNPHVTQVTRPCTLAPPPPKMILGPTEEMDPKLWGNLQHHIDLWRVFAKLPFREFFQLRLVCKDFNARTYDEKFLEANANPLIKKPFFCLVHPDDNWQFFLQYGQVLNEWHQLPIPTPIRTSDHYPPRWSAGGYLVFVESKWPDYWIFTVFDLCTRMQHKLPPLYKDGKSYSRDWNLQGLVVNQVDNTFQLVIAEMGTKQIRTIRTSVFDSVTRAWDHKVQPFPFGLTDVEVFSSPPHGSVCHNGDLYIAMYDVPCLMCYDLATGVWSSLRYTSKHSSAVDLGCWGGHLYAVSSNWDQGTGTMELYVRQLFEGTHKRWDEVCSIPLDLFDELFETNDPSPTWNECDIFLETFVQASFCDEYVFISVFLQDYFVVDSGCGGYKIWCRGTLVPRRFALLNLETGKWERLDFPISRDRRRMEVGTEDCGFVHRDKKRVGKMVKEMIKEKLKERKCARG